MLQMCVHVYVHGVFSKIAQLMWSFFGKRDLAIFVENIFFSEYLYFLLRFFCVRLNFETLTFCGASEQVFPSHEVGAIFGLINPWSLQTE